MFNEFCCAVIILLDRLAHLPDWHLCLFPSVSWLSSGQTVYQSAFLDHTNVVVYHKQSFLLGLHICLFPSKWEKKKTFCKVFLPSLQPDQLSQIISSVGNTMRQHLQLSESFKIQSALSAEQDKLIHLLHIVLQPDKTFQTLPNRKKNEWIWEKPDKSDNRLSGNSNFTSVYNAFL